MIRSWIVAAGCGALLFGCTGGGRPSAASTSTTTSTTTATTTTASTTTTTSAIAATDTAAGASTGWSVTATPTEGDTGPTHWKLDQAVVSADGATPAIALTIGASINTAVRESLDKALSTPTDEQFPLIQYSATFVQFSVLGDRYLGVTFDDYYDYGGAHGTPDPMSLSFDLSTGTAVDPLSLFRTPEDGLSALSDAALARLQPYLHLDETDELSRQNTINGSAPTLENYRNLTLRPDGMLVRFTSYQVASFADGMIRVLVPWRELESALRPNAVPAAWRTSPRYTIGVIATYFGDPLPAVLGELDDVLFVRSDAPETWLFATVHHSSEVVVLHGTSDATFEHTSWVVAARGHWPLGCGDIPPEVLAPQGIDC